MSQTISQIRSQPATEPAMFGVAKKILQNLLTHIKKEARIRRDIAKAQSLDDHILADIALERREIKNAVRSGRWTIEKVKRDD
jgi:uncharacterized protein YjiS (DUF1127 family)